MRNALWTCAALLLAPTWSSATSASTAGVTLKRPLSARVAALGEAFSAVDGGVSSLGINPAGAAALKRPALETTFTSGVIDDAFGFAGYAHPLKTGVAAAGLAYYDSGSADFVFSNGTQETRTAQRDMVGLAGWAVPLGGGLSAGGLAKFYRFELAQEARSSGFAADLGAQWAAPVAGLRLGGALQNLGPDVKFESESDPLPMTARFGAAWTTEARPAHAAENTYSAARLTLAADAIKIRDERIAAAIGGEFGLDVGDMTSVVLRLGCVLNRDADGVSLGMGIREGRYTVDYALGNKRDLGNVHHISFGVRF